jgi:hypothetical protein
VHLGRYKSCRREVSEIGVSIFNRADQVSRLQSLKISAQVKSAQYVCNLETFETCNVCHLTRNYS